MDIYEQAGKTITGSISFISVHEPQIEQMKIKGTPKVKITLNGDFQNILVKKI
jgi:hypothetical protein